MIRFYMLTGQSKLTYNSVSVWAGNQTTSMSKAEKSGCRGNVDIDDKKSRFKLYLHNELVVPIDKVPTQMT